MRTLLFNDMPLSAHRPEPIPGQPERDPFTEPQPDDTPGFPPGSRPGPGTGDSPIDSPLEIRVPTWH